MKKTDQYYFLSDKYLQTITPRVPDNRLTRRGYEDNKTERICVAPSIEQCLFSIGIYNKEIKRFYVYRPSKSDYIHHVPTEEEVPDINITDELWLLEPVNLTLMGIIETNKTLNNGVYRWVKRY